MGEQFLFFCEGLIRNISGSLGKKIRYIYYRKRLGCCGTNVIIEEGVFFQSPKYIELSNNIWIDKNVILIAGPFDSKDRKYYQKGDKIIQWGKLVISEGVHLAPTSIIQSHGGVRVGKNVTIAAGAKVYSLSHHYKNLSDPFDKSRYSFSTMAPKEMQYMIIGNVLINDNSAVGLNAVILPGTILPEGTWIGVLSTPPYNQLQSNSVFSSLNPKNE